MIPQANDAFWQKLYDLDFLAPELVQNWQAFSSSDGANWAELCKRIVAESVLRPAHLNQLASASGQRVVWGNYLLLRPAYHPLGWQTYQALHAKLHKEFRLIFLPGKEVDFAVGSQPQKVDLLERARKVASISSNDIVKVIDIELFENVTVAVTQLPVGKRLTQLLLQEDSPEHSLGPENWVKCIESLCSDLTLIHDAGVTYGGVDPLAIQFDPATNRCRLDYLISNPVLAASEMVPMDLSPDEQANIVEFRSLRSSAITSATETLSPQYDWMTLGVLISHIANKLANDASDFKAGVMQFGSQLQTGKSTSREQNEKRIQSLKELALRTTKALPLESAQTTLALPNDSTTPTKSKASSPSRTSLSQKRQANKSREDRKKLATMLAVVSPFPIVLVGFLIYYFGYIADSPRPSQLTDRSPIGDLPEMTQTSETAPIDSEESDSNKTVQSPDSSGLQRQSETTDSKKIAAEYEDNPNVSEDSSMSDAVSEEKIDLSPLEPESTTVAKPELEPNRENSAGDELPELEMGNFNPLPEDQGSENEPAIVTMDSVENQPEDSVSGGTFTFEGLKTSIDLASTLTQRLEEQARNGNADQPVVYSLGEFNSTTARLATVSWLSNESNPISMQEIDQQEHVRQWKIVSTTDSTPLAKLQATQEGQLELAVLPQAENALEQLMVSKLSFGFADDKTLEKSIKLFEPRKVAKLEFANKGAIRNINWETPELAGQTPILKLSMSGRPMNQLPGDSSLQESLNLKRGENLYYMGEALLPGTMVLVGRLTPGKKTRFQAQLMLLTPQGLIKYDEPGKAAAVAEAINQQKLQWIAQYDQIKSVRAKPGQGDAKARKLDELEALQKAAAAFLKAMEPLLENGESIYADGVDFELRMGAETNSIVLLESETTDDENQSPETLDEQN